MVSSCVSGGLPDQNQNGSRRWLLKRLEKRICRLVAQVVRVFNDGDSPSSPHRLQAQIEAKLTNGEDGQFLAIFRFRYHEDIGVRAFVHLKATWTVTARNQARLGVPFAEQGLGQCSRKQGLADPGRTDEQEGVRKPTAGQRPTERLNLRIMASDQSPGHMPPHSESGPPRCPARSSRRSTRKAKEESPTPQDTPSRTRIR